MIGVPKTIDNDLEKPIIHSAIKRLSRWPAMRWTACRPPGRSHDRVMILEVMGRNAGWIALWKPVLPAAPILF
ncbi:MAG: 6-phosphofructokinase [Desulfobacterales bacterium]